MAAKEKSENSSLGHRKRLRDRYARGGLSALSDYEVVELMLTFFIPRIDVKPIAKDLIKKYKNLRGIIETPPEELIKTNGIGESAAISIKFFKDCITLAALNDLEVSEGILPTISKLIKFFRSKIASEKHEVLEMVCLDAKLRIIPDGSVRLFEGSVTSANVDIRKIIEIAIKKGASSIAIAHNHPSGDPSPSLEDIRVTRRISKAGELLGIQLLDHVIIGDRCYSSLRERGILSDKG